MIDLAPDQEAAVDQILDWSHSDRPYFSLAGLAGTGKTTILHHIVPLLQPCSVCALTGQACSVLRSKGITAHTLHSTYYRYRRPHFEVIERAPSPLLVNDEASMTPPDMIQDIRSLGVRILFVGDHGQLPPVLASTTGFSPLKEPDVTLTHIHRQALDSPIIRFAHELRASGHMRPVESEHLTVSRFTPYERERLIADLASGVLDVCIVGKNQTRRALNNAVRVALGRRSPHPAPGDLICVLKNNPDLGVYNGTRARVLETWDESFLIETENGETVRAAYNPDGFLGEKPPMFGDPDRIFADYGWVVTAHKSQGSQWPSVAVVHEIPFQTDPRRWSYTAATRAQTTLRYLNPLL